MSSFTTARASSAPDRVPRFHDVEDAARRIAGTVRRTPVLSNDAIDRQCRGGVHFKCENLQRGGSFKLRGATNAVSHLREMPNVTGVLTHSSGNHAAALAIAAAAHDLPAWVVMPSDAAPSKIRAVLDHGAQLTTCAPDFAAREEVAAALLAETGAAFVDSHDDPWVIAGQATAALELALEVADLEIVLVPVGGGGLIAGTVIALSQLAPRCEVIGCEPAGADDAFRSLAEGRRITEFVPRTIADGLRTPLGMMTFEIMRRHVRRVLRVEESDIQEAMRTVWERLKLVIEPSSAVAVAPLLDGAIDISGRRVGVILSGGNVGIPG